MSHDGKVLISASGYANREDLAPICIHDTTQWKLKKKLNFHYKGIQMIKLSSSQKYMISAGNKYEKSICVWNFQNLTVIDSKSLKFPIIDIQPERSTINDNLLYFTTISFDVLSFWRMDSNFRLEGFHLKFEDITDNREEGEIFTALENTPYYDKIKTSFIIIGTNAGAILIIDKEKKILIRKFYISKTPITKILFQKDNFICAGESPIVYCWRYDPERINSEYVFDFLEKEKSRLIFIDSNIVSISFTENEGLIGTDTGSIFFGSFANESAIKILSSHNNCFINSIDYDHNNEFILTSGDDGIVRCWTQDTFDQKFQFMKLDSKCESAMINHSDNVCTVIYDNYMRIYDMNSLRSLGKIKIPDNDINYYGFIFNYQGMIVSTLQDRVFIFDVQNWDPLSLLYTEISNSFMPKNQFFKSIDTKSLNMNKSLVVISFSDGTTSVVSLEKNKGKIETEVIDKFNMFEYHISKSDDMHIAEMYQNLTKFRVNLFNFILD
jgi:WD40 repeat protein